LTIWAVVLCGCLAAASTADAKPQHQKHAGDRPARLDPSFGSHGVTKVATPESERPVKMALGPGGRTYILQKSLLLAFEANGKPARSFGTNGRVTIAPDKGTGETTALAVDSQGRVLVTGSTYLGGHDAPLAPVLPTDEVNAGLAETFVIRFLSNGSRDINFGSNGEVDTTFGLPGPSGAAGSGVEYQTPIARPTAIAVDAQGRPVVGGAYVKAIYPCGAIFGPPASFLARLTPSGAIDTSFAGKGYLTGSNGEVTALAGAPGGGATLLTGGNFPCAARSPRELSSFAAVTENGEPSPALSPARPSFLTARLLAVDGRGRALVVQEHDEFSEEPGVLVRLLPSGLIDTGFGHGGGASLTGRLSSPGGVAVDAKGRPIVAGGGPGVELLRLKANGKVDSRFGPKGVVKGGARGNTAGSVGAVAVDSEGRIYVASWVQSAALKTGGGIQVARFLPGS
jgi:uncharacterized delta-60 repeat protein